VFRKISILYSQYKDVDASNYKKQPRPLLILLDRNMDLHTPLYHSWTYLSLIEEVFGIKNNQFNYQEDSKAQAVTYELDFSTDEILKENAFSLFHEAAE
jgi:hypothetical protein